MYECLYGHTPFLSEAGGRQETKRNIVNHKQTFAFPSRPLVSNRCMELISRLVCEKDSRLCSKRYAVREKPLQSSPLARTYKRYHQDHMGRSVFPHDAEDLKAHRWFRDIPWDRLHLIPPPFVPQISGLEDTHYFDEEEPISDWSESQPDTETEIEDEGSTTLRDSAATNTALLSMTAPGMAAMPMASMAPPPRPCLAPHFSSRKMAELHATLASYPKQLRNVMSQFVATPYDSTRLKRIHREIEHMSPNQDEIEKLKQFVRDYGKKERKRPRDRLLRDRQTKGIVLDIRKQSAFLGYTWTRTRGREFQIGMIGATTTDAVNFGHMGTGKDEEDASVTAAYEAWHGGGM